LPKVRLISRRKKIPSGSFVRLSAPGSHAELVKLW
jgi:hypothetical protein